MNIKLTIVSLLLFAVLAIGYAAYIKAPDLMFVTKQSQHSFDKTVQIITEKVTEEGWVYSGESKISKSVAAHGGGTLPPITVLKVCNADHAYNILKTQKFRYLSAMMPCSISVYEGDDGKIYVSHFNTKLMGMLFPDPVKTIMTQDVTNFLNNITAQL